MKILIIGSEGFIGHHCIVYLKAKHDVVGCDLLDVKSSPYPYYMLSRMEPGYDRLFSEHQFDACVNAAGSGSVPNSIANPFGDFEANTMDTFRVLDSIRRFNPKCRYLNSPVPLSMEIRRTCPSRRRDECKPYHLMAGNKYYSELICREFHVLHGIAACSVRPFSVFGPGTAQTDFLGYVSEDFERRHRALFGSGQESRDFIYITDLVKCIDLILAAGKMNGDVF